MERVFQTLHSYLEVVPGPRAIGLGYGALFLKPDFSTWVAELPFPQDGKVAFGLKALALLALGSVWPEYPCLLNRL